jgi:hypothetical protein
MILLIIASQNLGILREERPYLLAKMLRSMKSSDHDWPERSNSSRNASRNSSFFLESGIYPRKGVIITVFTKIAKPSRSEKGVVF